jgi:hypothetical protein
MLEPCPRRLNQPVERGADEEQGSEAVVREKPNAMCPNASLTAPIAGGASTADASIACAYRSTDGQPGMSARL